MLRMFYDANLSLKIIAKKMGITYEYARHKIRRIRRKLRDMLDNDPDFDFRLIS